MYGIRAGFIEILEDIHDIIDENDTVNIEDENIDEDIIEIITHTYYADSKVIRIVTDYRYKNDNEIKKD